MMTNKNLVKIHVMATVIATLTIGTFFISSLLAELNGDVEFIKSVKRSILYILPLLIITMPAVAITGNRLAGKSRHQMIIKKKLRMKFMMVNGIILTSLAIFLYFQSHFRTINYLFLIAQITELVFGLCNLILIGLNVKTGLLLSGKFKIIKAKKALDANGTLG